MIFKKHISYEITRLKDEVFEVRQLLRSIDSSLTLMLAVKKNDIPEDTAPKQKPGRNAERVVQIGSLLHGKGVKLSEFRAEAMREGWLHADEIKYDTLVGRKDAEDLILKAGIRKVTNSK